VRDSFGKVTIILIGSTAKLADNGLSNGGSLNI
jgi:hypothetical protein